MILDVLLRRGPWLADAEAIRRTGREGRLEGCMTASALTDIYYIGRRLVGREAVRPMIRECLDTLTILPIDLDDLEAAFAFPHPEDFEDALQLAAACRYSLDAVITRNPRDFAHSPVPILSPSELVSRLSAADD